MKESWKNVARVVESHGKVLEFFVSNIVRTLYPGCPGKKAIKRLK